MPLVNINPKKVLCILVGVSIVFIVLNLLRLAWIDALGPDVLNGLWDRLNLDYEQTFPTWFSSVMLLSASLTLVAITAEKQRAGECFARHWAGLALIFCLLSIDEVAGAHEALIGPVRRLVGAQGLLHFAWVIPGMLFVLAFAATYLRFVWHLSPRFRKLFVASGATYVFGAVVMEMVSGEIVTHLGHHLFFNLEATVEEGCEMLGASLFVYTVLTYLQTMVRSVNIGIGSASPEPSGMPAIAPSEPNPVADAASSGAALARGHQRHPRMHDADARFAESAAGEHDLRRHQPHEIPR